MRYLDPTMSKAPRRAVDSFRQDIGPRMTEDWVDTGFPLPPGCFAPGIIRPLV
jgi:hypothetical protein